LHSLHTQEHTQFRLDCITVYTVTYPFLNINSQLFFSVLPRKINITQNNNFTKSS